MTRVNLSVSSPVLEVVQRQVAAASTILRLAVGIIMGQNRCPQDKVFEILRAASDHRNVKLRELAAEVVATVGRGPVTSHFDA